MSSSDPALPSRVAFLTGALAVALIAILGLRTLIEVTYFLPSPGSDGVLFLHVSHNLCEKGFLGSESFPLDPTGGARFVWHGFLSPYFYGGLGLGCTAGIYYLLSTALKIATALLVLVVARKAGQSRMFGFALAILVVAVQAKLQFRPEPLAIFIVFLAEWALLASRPVALGISGALLCWCQPTVFGLYGLFLLLRKGSTLLKWSGWLLGGFGVTFIGLAALYPFPLHDLLTGLSLQASKVSISGEHGGGGLDYYLATHFLPLWFALFVAAFAACCRRAPWLLLMAPALWWFGPRVPPINYNLIALLPVIVLVAMTAAGRRASRGGRAFLDTKLVLHKWMNCSIVTAAMPNERSSNHETVTPEPFVKVQSPGRPGSTARGVNPRRAFLAPRGACQPDWRVAQATAGARR